MDEKTRTATARVIIDNSDGHYRPGLFVNAKVHTNTHNVPIAVPSSAIVDVENQPVVFIQTEHGLEPQPVKIGESDQQTVQIVQGLTARQIYVSHNAFALKAQLQKGAFGHGHAH